MKGVMNKLSFSLGKKKKEAQNNSAVTKEQPSTIPDESRPDTDTSAHLSASHDDPENTGPHTSRPTAYEPSTEVSQEGACSSLEIPEETLIQPSQKENYKLYKDPVESKINKDSTPQEIPYAIIDSDRITSDDKKYRDGTNADRHVFGLAEETRDPGSFLNKNQPYNYKENDAAYCLPGERETITTEVPQIFLRNRDNDNDIVETSDFLPIRKEVHYPVERAENEYPEMPGLTFHEFLERDKHLTFDINRDMDYYPPQVVHYSPEDPRIIRSHFQSNNGGDINSPDYLYAKYGRVTQNPMQDSGNYSEGSYFSPRLKEEAFSGCNPREKGHLQYDPDLDDYLYKKRDKKTSTGFIYDIHPYQQTDKNTTLKYDDDLEKVRIKPDTTEFQKDKVRFDGYTEPLHYTYRSGVDAGKPNNQYKQSSSTYDQNPRYNSNGKTFDFDNPTDVSSRRREYYGNTESGSHLKAEKMSSREDAFVKHESDPDAISRDDFIEKTVVTSKTKERAGPIFINPKRHNPLSNSQHPPVNSNIKSEDKDNAYSFNENQRFHPSKRGTNVSSTYKSRNLKGFKDRTLNLIQRKDETFDRHLSLFGRWMIIHGHLVDPYDFCLWSYASRPEEYIDLSQYQMDLRGRWLDTNGRMITPFFYCYNYDGEPIYLGDCDSYDVFTKSYDASTNDSKKFANNPERFIDLSDFQMDMDERWLDCYGRYVDPFSEWYAIESPENESSEYDWLYNRPETLALSCYPETMCDYFTDYPEDNPFLPKPIPELEDYLFSEKYMFWGYPPFSEGLSDDPSNRPYLWSDTEHFCDGFKDIKQVGDGNESYSYDQIKLRPKKKKK